MTSFLTRTLLLGCMGVLIGYFAQRSRMCFVAGIRDYILVRDKELLIGIVSFVCTVWLLTSILGGTGVMHQGVPEYGETYSLQAKVSEDIDDSGNFGMSGDSVQSFGGRIQITEQDSKGRSVFNRFFAVTLIGGFAVGILAVFAGGCVLRQHILCAQGQRNSLFFLAGFYLASIAFYTLLFPYFQWVYE